MKIGLIGLPNSGKTTIFNALTKMDAEVTAYANVKAEPNLAIINVGDERVTQLSKMYEPKKTTFATVEFVDFVGLSKGSAKEGTFSSTSMQMIKNNDALAMVARNFHDDLMGKPSPMEDIIKTNEELLLADLIVVENRLERIEANYNRGLKTNELQLEEKTLRIICEQLNNTKPIRDIELNREQERIIHGFQFFTNKPLMVILNSDEADFGKNSELLTEIEQNYKVIEFAGKFEMELSRLDEEETEIFLEDMGIKESARNRLTKLAYHILGYISFFTVGSDEVRAWNICEGDTALEAAGTIHSDLARGFIRAECFSFNDLMQFGSEKSVRENGLFRLEGKDYIVRDGDTLSIRFNV